LIRTGESDKTMRPDSGIDQTSLAWIKPEIDACLARAAEALERYAENGFQGDSAQLALAELHQVQGVLRIMELYGAALVAEEMERLLAEVIADRVKRMEDALTSLLRASLQLPDYLESLQAGNRDVPIVLLPLLNDLRSCRGEQLLSESVLLIPPADPELPPNLPHPPERLAAGALERNLIAIRRAWQFALLEWFRGKDSDAGLARIGDLSDELLKVLWVRSARKLWWVAGAVVEALREHTLDASISVKLLFGRLDREIKRLIDQGEGLYAEEPSEDLQRSLLYYVAQAGAGGERIDQVREAFRLEDLLPSSEELDHARGVLGGRNSQLLGSVVHALEEELLRVKDALDLYLRGNRADASGLAAELPVLDRVADTLGILGMGLERSQVQAQRQALTPITEGGQVDEQTLLDIAAALLNVETALHGQRDGLGWVVREDEGQPLPGRLTGIERQRLIQAALAEVAINLQNSKELFIGQLSADTPGDNQRLETAVNLMRDVAGALWLLKFDDAAERTLALAGFLREVGGRGQPLTADEVESYADAVSGVEYYLELIADHRGHDDRHLQPTTQALIQLGHWPPTVSLRELFDSEIKPVPGSARAKAAEAVAGATPSQPGTDQDSGDGADPAGSATGDSDTVQAVAAAGATPDLPAELLALQAAREEFRALVDWSGYGFADTEAGDDEIRETFLEELEEQIGQLDEYLPRWRQNPDDLGGLREIRRSFHTIKGSGRMVGASLLGEFSWQVENLLNRVLNGGRPASLAVISLVESSAAALPEFHTALLGGQIPQRDVAGTMAIAQVLADGKDVTAADLERLPDTAPAQSLAAAEPGDEPGDEAASVAGALDDVRDLPPATDTGNDAPATAEDPAVADVAGAAIELEPESIGLAVSGLQPGAGSEAEAEAEAEPETGESSEPVSGPAIDTGSEPVPAVSDSAGQETLAPETSVMADTAAQGGAEPADSAAAPAATASVTDDDPWTLADVGDVGDVGDVAAASAQSEDEPETPAASAAGPVESPDAIDPWSVSDPAQADDAAVDAEQPTALDADAGQHAGQHAEQEAIGELDPILLDILRSEVAGHLGVIETYLRDAEKNSALAIVPEHLLRAVHTLNGAFGAVDISQVSTLTIPFESYVRRLRGLHMAPIAAGRETIAEATLWLAQALDHLDQKLPLPPLEGLPDAFRALTAELPEVRDDTAWLFDGARMEEADADEDDDFALEGLDELPELTPVVGHAATEATDSSRTGDPADSAATDDNTDIRATEQSESSSFDPASQPVASDGAPPAEADPEGETDPNADLALDEHSAEATAIAPLSDDAEEAETAAADPSTEQLPVMASAAEAPPVWLADSEPAPDSDPVEPLTAEAALIDGDDDIHDPDRYSSEQYSAEDVAGAVDSQTLRHLLARLPATPPDDLDADLAELFREEARELLDRCEQHLAEQSDHSHHEVLSRELARELHTLKGGARMAGFTAAGDLGHAMESLLEMAALDRRSFDDSELTLIGQCLDRLNQLVFVSEDAGASAVMPAAEPVAAAPQVVPDQAQVTAIDGDDDVPMPALLEEHGPDWRPERFVPPVAVPEVIPEKAVGEFVRVRADQLDSLVNLAGEVGIIRTRMEQQVGAFRFNLEELEQTVQRLRDQLRKLEIEAETQILSREVRVQDSGDAHFDPLELDRFSQLQQLSRALAESMSDLQSIQGLLEEHTRLAESLLLQQSRAGAELQEGLMRARMVPFESMLPRLRRLVRQESTEMGKRVRLTIEGSHGELDRGVLERMAAPFEHMLRNALVHGLEAPEERLRAGKDSEGEITIRVMRQATEVVIEVIDDGRGIDPQRIRSTAIERGLLAPESELSDRDLFGFIMEQGFSTADELTQYAGRGVGLDVVASEIKQLGGNLSIDSVSGQGATFRIRLPYTLAVSQAVLVRVAEHTFAVPMAGVQGIVRLSHSNYQERMAQDHPKVEYAGEDYELYELDGMLGLPAIAPDENAQVPLLMIHAGDLRAALRVDSLLGGREIVVKPVGPQLARIPGVFGATILGDGAVVVILDGAVLLRRAAALRARGEAPSQVVAAPTGLRTRPLVMVVDDSITMRKVSGRVLEREGYEVHTAKDGLDALEQMHERVPDLMLLDLEMPRMDGYELAGYMRGDSRFRSVPIIVITSRVGEKHRARAFELGVNRYLGKPYQESEMINSVAELLAESAATASAPAGDK